MAKKKLGFSEQIEFLKNKNIRLDYNNIDDNIDEKEVRKILEKRNSLFKLKTFSNGYHKDCDDKYIDLDFKTLHRFNVLDTSFRALVLELSLMCEHLLKVKINYLCSTNPKDNGYDVVQEYFHEKDFPSEIVRYKRKNKNYYMANFMKRYADKTEEMAVWNLLEILTFSETIDFYNFYLDYFDRKTLRIFELKPVKNLRNAAAHNNCILHLLGEDMYKLSDKEYSKNIEKFLDKHSLSNDMGRMFLIHDFLCLIYLVNKICPKGQLKEYAKKHTYDFFVKFEKKEWFKYPNSIKERYEFIKNTTNLMFNNP